MDVVIDANLLVVLISGDQRREAVLRVWQNWREQKIQIHTPVLAYYEIANSLTRLIVAGLFPQEQLETAWEMLENLSITYHDFSLSTRVIDIALSLHRQNAYDAAYLTLAEVLSAELWTLDGPLYRNATGKGFAVRLLS